MAISNYYVDPVGGNDTTGDGSIGTPWATVQKALDTITRNGTDGDQINVKAGGADVLSSALSLTTYGTSLSAAAPLIIRGYTSAANDGGIGQVSGNSSVAVFSGTVSHFQIVDMSIINGVDGFSNSGATVKIINCSFTGNSGAYACRVGASSMVERCYFSGNSSTADLYFSNSGGAAYHNYIAKSSGSYGIQTASGNAIVGNIVNLGGTGLLGIFCQGGTCFVMLNSVYNSTAGTSRGIYINANTNSTVVNNIVEGFSGAGGDGIEIVNNSIIAVYGYNAYYNNTSSLTNGGKIDVNLGNDQSLGASPFTAPGSGNFSVGATVKALAWPSAFNTVSTSQYLDIGAAQIQIPTASGGRRPRGRYHGI